MCPDSTRVIPAVVSPIIYFIQVVDVYSDIDPTTLGTLIFWLEDGHEQGNFCIRNLSVPRNKNKTYWSEDHEFETCMNIGSESRVYDLQVQHISITSLTVSLLRWVGVDMCVCVFFITFSDLWTPNVSVIQLPLKCSYLTKTSCFLRMILLFNRLSCNFSHKYSFVQKHSLLY